MKVIHLLWKIVAKACATIAVRDVGEYILRQAIDKIRTARIREKAEKTKERSDGNWEGNRNLKAF